MSHNASGEGLDTSSEPGAHRAMRSSLYLPEAISSDELPQVAPLERVTPSGMEPVYMGESKVKNVRAEIRPIDSWESGAFFSMCSQ